RDSGPVHGRERRLMSDAREMTTGVGPRADQAPEGSGEAAKPPAGVRRPRLSGPNQRQVLGLVAVLAILVAVGTATSEQFFALPNFLLILAQSSIIGVLAVG